MARLFLLPALERRNYRLRASRVANKLLFIGIAQYRKIFISAYGALP